MAETREHAQSAFDQVRKRFEAKYPKAMECLAKDRDELLAFYDFSVEHWAHLRTTNPIESTFATVRPDGHTRELTITPDSSARSVAPCELSADCAELERWGSRLSTISIAVASGRYGWPGFGEERKSHSLGQMSTCLEWSSARNSFLYFSIVSEIVCATAARRRTLDSSERRARNGAARNSNMHPRDACSRAEWSRKSAGDGVSIVFFSEDTAWAGLSSFLVYGGNRRGGVSC